VSPRIIESTIRSAPIDTTAEIETPEHVCFHVPIAGPTARAVAYLLDALIRAGILLVLAVTASIGGLAIGDAVSGISAGVILVVLFVLEWCYYTFWEIAWNGTTPGKRALDLRVVSVHGHPLRIGDSFLRNLLRAADFLPWGYALGLISMSRDTKFRRLGDLVAGTMVVVEERRTVASTIRIEPPPTQKELASLPQRLPLSGDELDALEHFLRRKDKIGLARENELASMVAPVFARRMGLRVNDASRFLTLLYARARSASRRPT
jgi:uncharacterized RDD family membrane protein YckC